MNNILKLKEMPYLFLLLVGLVSFLTSKALEGPGNSILVTFDKTIESTGITYKIQNISKDKSVTNVTAFIHLEGISVSSPNYLPPAVEPDEPQLPKKLPNSRWVVDIGTLTPLAAVEIKVIAPNNSLTPEFKLKTNEPASLIEAGVFSYLYGNQFYVYIILAVISVIGLICYGLYLYFSQTIEEKTS